MKITNEMKITKEECEFLLSFTQDEMFIMLGLSVEHPGLDILEICSIMKSNS